MSEAAILQSRRAIYVGGIAEEVNSTILRAAFIPFGPVKAIELPMDYAKGIHKSFAFVEFEDPDDAEEAIYNMDGAELMGKTLSVSLAQANQMRQSNKAVWSSDEWFQQQAGIDKTEPTAKAEDQSALKEQAPIP